MTNYNKSTDFAVKDVLLTGNPNKLVKGSEVDVEFSNMELADATNVKKTGNTGSAVMPVGTTAQRDVAPAVGYTRVNTSTGTLEWWNGTIWTSANGGDAYDIEVTTATGGQTVITTGNNFIVGSNTLMVYLNGLLVNKTTDYTETTTTSFTFNSGLTAGDEVVAQIWRTNISTSGDAMLVSYTPAGTGAVATTVQAKLRESVSITDKGGDNTGAVSCSAIIELLAADGKAIYFPAGTYTVATEVTLPSNTILYAHRDATIVSTIPTVVSSYQPIFKTSAARSNIAIIGLKFQTANNEQAVLSTLYSITNLRLIDNECQGCGLVRLFDGGRNVWIDGNYIHSPTTEGSFNNYARPIKVSSTWAGTSSYNINITDNVVLGSWTHGIEVFGGTVMDSLTPTVAKKISGVTVANNIVRAVSSAASAGGIWFSQVQDVSVTGNTVELYGDVGIDFEACTNAVATGNTLRNNNKNLAMYGNNKGVTFSGNTCYNTVAGLAQFYAKPANNNSVDYQVDARNTDILIDGNTFISDVTVTAFESLDIGSGGEIVVSNNKLVNTNIKANKFSLTDITIKNNHINLNASGVSMVPIQVSQSYATGDATVTPLKATIAGNIITHSNPAATAFSILYQNNDTVGASMDFDFYLDICDNEIRCDASKYAIYIQNSATITPTKYLYHTLARNKCWGSIEYVGAGNRTVVKNVTGNMKQNGQPYTTTRTTAGALNIWDESNISTVGSVGTVSFSLANGEYNGQQKQIYMTAIGGFNGIVIIASHRLGINQNATFSAAGQFALLQWNVDRWDTIKATCAGI